MRKTPSDPKTCNRSATLGARAFAAISAVEGLQLTAAGRKRVQSAVPIEKRRAEVLRTYKALKTPK